MIVKNLPELIEKIDLRGKATPSALLKSMTSSEHACDCGACDDGGYCICDCDYNAVGKVGHSESKKYDLVA